MDSECGPGPCLREQSGKSNDSVQQTAANVAVKVGGPCFACKAVTNINARQSRAIMDVTPPEIDWSEFGIFSSAMKERRDFAQVQQANQTLVAKLSAANQRALCESFGKSCPETDEDRLPGLMVEAIGADNINCLTEFMARRGKSIREVFSWLPKKKQAIVAAVDHHSKQGGDKAANLLKLMVLYRNGSKWLRHVFYHAEWQSKATSARLTVQDVNHEDIVNKVCQSSSELGQKLNHAANVEGKILHPHQLPDSTMVLVFLRSYSPQIKRDHQKDVNVHHGVGTLVIGVASASDVLQVKSSNRAVVETIVGFLRELFDGKTVCLDFGVCDDYDHDLLVKKFTGQVEIEASNLLLTGVKFRRTSLSEFPLELHESSNVESVTPAVSELTSKGLLKGQTIFDLGSLSLRFEGCKVEVTNSIEKSGSLRLTYDNVGMAHASQAVFEKLFRNEFGVSLHVRLSPQGLPKGTRAIIRSILSTRLVTEVEDFQRDVLTSLVDNHVVEIVDQKVWLCKNKSCNEHRVTEAGPDSHCGRCGHQLAEHVDKVIQKNPKAIRRLVLKAVRKASGWTVQSTESSFESIKYLKIKNDAAINFEDDYIALFPIGGLGPKATETMDRLACPTLTLDDNDIDKNAWIERDASGKVSLPLILSAIVDAKQAFEVKADLQRIFTELMQTHHERTSRAARLSLERVRNAASVVATGKEFETDILNLVRTIFPYAIRLGREGKAEPDGLIPVPDYRNQSEDQPATQFIIGYDAKLNLDGAGYDIGAGEQRKVKDYVVKYRLSRKRLGGMARRIEVHAFISNNMNVMQLDRTVRYLRGPLGLDGDKPIHIALFTSEFFVELATWFLGDPVECIRKRPFLYEKIIAIIEKAGYDSPSVFDTDEAKFLMEAPYYVVEDRVTAAEAVAAFEPIVPEGIGVRPIAV